MGTYFPPLNLTLDADERDVKRAYAARLKETRPDDDPVAFQALVAARDRALDWVRRRRSTTFAGLDAVTARTATPEVSQPSDMPATAADAVTAVGFDVDAGQAPATLAGPETVDLSKQMHDTPVRPPPTVSLPLASYASAAALRASPDPGFAQLIRAQQTSRTVLTGMALSLIRDEANGAVADVPERWRALLTAAEDLDLAGRMALERTIATELDGVMQQQTTIDPAAIDAYAATVLRLDRAFGWSRDLRRIVRLLGEPSGTHPLVFAVERFGDNAIRLRMTPAGFPLIPESDLVAWFGSPSQPGVKAYARAVANERFQLGWSWYAFLSPPSWAIRIGAPVAGVAFAVAMIVAVYVLFDPIGNVWTANAFASFLAVLLGARIAAALSARVLETAALVRILKRIEAGPLPPAQERRRLIAAGHGSRLLNVIAGLFFLLLVDGFCLTLIIPAMTLPSPLVAEMIVDPDRKTPGVTFADRLIAQSYLDHGRQIAEDIDDLIKAERGLPPNPLRLRRIETLQQNFVGYIKTLPIGDFAPEFDRFRQELARLKRRP